MIVSNSYNQNYTLNAKATKSEEGGFSQILNESKEELENSTHIKRDGAKVSYGQLMNKDLSEFTMLITAEWIAANREAMAIQGVSELSQLDKNLLSAVRMKRSSETDPDKIRQMLEQNQAILKSGAITSTAVGAESFDLRKSEALNHINELLALI